METPRSHVRKICSDAEYDLVKSSFETGYRASPPRRLKQKIALVRKLRDKYRDMARRKGRQARRRDPFQESTESVDATPPMSPLRAFVRKQRLAQEEAQRPAISETNEKNPFHDTAAERAGQKARVFSDALRRLEGELDRKSGQLSDGR
jgi:hypothetical protein